MVLSSISHAISTSHPFKWASLFRSKSSVPTRSVDGRSIDLRLPKSTYHDRISADRPCWAPSRQRARRTLVAEAADSVAEPATFAGHDNSDCSSTKGSSSNGLITLRPYQEDAVAAVLANARDGVERQLISLPTGTGKTVIFAELARRVACERNCRVLVLAHRTELILQAKARFQAIWPDADVSILQGDTKQYGRQVTNASVQTACKAGALEQLRAQDYGLVIVDEAHHTAAATYLRILGDLGFWSGAELLLESESSSDDDDDSSASVDSGSNSEEQLPNEGGSEQAGVAGAAAQGEPAAADGAAAAEGGAAAGEAQLPIRLLVGFTATPNRTDGQGLGKVYQRLAYHRTIDYMVDHGYLVKPRGERIMTQADLTGIRSSKNSSGVTDFSRKQLVERVNTPQRNQLVVDSYLSRAAGRPAIAFCCDVQHAKDLEAAFNAAGVACSCVHGNMSEEDRATVLDDFAAGKYQVITNCMVLTEGYDESRISCVLMARPTRSQLLYIQCVGRGLRLHPGKEDCLVLDFTDKTHSLVTAVVLEDVFKPSDDWERPESGWFVGYKEKQEHTVNVNVEGGTLELLPPSLRRSEWAWQQYGPHSFLSVEKERSLWLLRCPPPPADTPAGASLSQQLEELQRRERLRDTPRYCVYELSHADWTWTAQETKGRKAAYALDKVLSYLQSKYMRMKWVTFTRWNGSVGHRNEPRDVMGKEWHDDTGKIGSLRRSAPWRKEAASEGQLALLRHLGHRPAARQQAATGGQQVAIATAEQPVAAGDRPEDTGLRPRATAEELEATGEKAAGAAEQREATGGQPAATAEQPAAAWEKAEVPGEQTGATGEQMSKGAASELICLLKLQRAHTQGRLSFPPGFDSGVAGEAGEAGHSPGRPVS